MNIPFPLKAFFFGALAASGALALELVLLSTQAVLSLPPDAVFEIDFVTLFLLAGIEESVKFLLLKRFFSANQPPNQSYLLVFGLAFSLIEILLITQHATPFGPRADVSSLLSIVMLHCATAIILGRICFQRKPQAVGLSGLLFAVSIHFLYNLSILYQFPPAVSFLLAFGSLTGSLLLRKSPVH